MVSCRFSLKSTHFSMDLNNGRRYRYRTFTPGWPVGLAKMNLPLPSLESLGPTYGICDDCWSPGKSSPSPSPSNIIGYFMGGSKFKHLYVYNLICMYTLVFDATCGNSAFHVLTDSNPQSFHHSSSHSSQKWRLHGSVGPVLRDSTGPDLTGDLPARVTTSNTTSYFWGLY